MVEPVGEKRGTRYRSSMICLLIVASLSAVAGSVVTGSSALSDTTPPDIYLRPDNITILVGETGHVFEWAVTDDNDTSGGYILYMKLPDIGWWPIDYGVWNESVVLSYSLDGFEAGIYYFRFMAQDWSQNFAEDVAQLIVVAELEPPQIEHTYSIFTGENSSSLVVEYTVTDDSGIRTIVFSHTTDGLVWENLTSIVEEPFNNKVISGSAWFPVNTVAYILYAEDAYCVWGKTDTVDVTITTVTSTTTTTASATATVTTSTTTSSGTQETQFPDLLVAVGLGAGFGVTAAVVALFIRMRGRKP